MYFILEPAVGTKETGHVFPAVESYGDYDFNAPNSVYKLDSDRFPNVIPNIRFSLSRGAKLCDLMGQATISASGLLVSERLKSILESECLIPHSFYQGTIEEKGISHIYYWLHLVWPEGIKFINFESSKFKIKKGSQELGEVKIRDYEDLLMKQGELGFLKVIYNFETHFQNVVFDLFIHPLNKTIYISDTLQNILRRQSTTGISIAPAHNLIMT